MTAIPRTVTAALCAVSILALLGGCRRAPAPGPAEAEIDFLTMELPEEPLPPYPGAIPEALQRPTSQQLNYVAPAPQDRVVDYYNAVFSRRGWTVHAVPDTPADLRLASYTSGNQIVLLRVTEVVPGQSTIQLYQTDWPPSAR